MTPTPDEKGKAMRDMEEMVAQIKAGYIDLLAAIEQMAINTILYRDAVKRRN
jgi:hypothetical protein